MTPTTPDMLRERCDQNIEELEDIIRMMRRYKRMTSHTIQTSVKITKGISVIREVSPVTINRLREIRRTARQLGYVLCLPNDYTTEDIDIAASELSSIIEEVI